MGDHIDQSGPQVPRFYSPFVQCGREIKVRSMGKDGVFAQVSSPGCTCWKFPHTTPFLSFCGVTFKEGLWQRQIFEGGFGDLLPLGAPFWACSGVERGLLQARSSRTKSLLQELLFLGLRKAPKPLNPKHACLTPYPKISPPKTLNPKAPLPLCPDVCYILSALP